MFLERERNYLRNSISITYFIGNIDLPYKKTNTVLNQIGITTIVNNNTYEMLENYNRYMYIHRHNGEVMAIMRTV